LQRGAFSIPGAFRVTTSSSSATVQTAVPVASRAAIVSPLVDALCAGGLSLLVLVPLLLSGRSDLLLVSVGVQAWLTTLVNMPHFLASYRMVYRSRASIRAHPWAATYVPGALLVCCVAAVVASRRTDLPISALLTVQNGYLAWHYTGQAWGMTAAYSYLDRITFSVIERRLVRGALYILLAWHVIWFFNLAFRNLGLDGLYQAVTLLLAVALAMGLVGFALQKARTGRFPPARALIPWLSIFVWYAAMARWGLPALFLVQIAHALQYLIFPMRVEVNRTRRSAGSEASRLGVVRHMALYLVLLLAGSIVAAVWFPQGAMAVVTSWLGSRPGQVVGFAILAFFNIHHFFTDGAVWKLRNPEVREDLFGHLPKPVPGVVPAAPAAANRRIRRVR
jgi:predicted membrane channel-forming protein YqfA (hemolysin III family)